MIVRMVGIMTKRVIHLNKKTGVSYVYEYTSYWDKEKKQGRNKQVCIGKIDPETGEIIPSKRLTSLKAPQQSEKFDLTVTASAQIIGPSLILNSLNDNLGLKDLLKSCFPQTYEQILMMAYYLVAEGGALTHCSTWCNSHAPSLAPSLTSQNTSKILADITPDQKQTFLNRWMKKMLEDDYLCYDITSVSSYSQINEYIKYGHNRDNEPLPQLNLALLFGQNGQLPVYFQRLPGNITDVSTIHNLLKTFKALEMKSLSYVLDKGFYSKKNVDEMTSSQHKFLIAVPLNNKWVQKAIDDVYETIQGPEGYRKFGDEVLYVHTRIYPWGEKKRRCYLHLYYNAKARAEKIDQFNEDLITYKEELESGNTNANHQNAYDTFFNITQTPKRGIKVTYNMEAVNQHIKRYTGYFALLSNKTKDPLEALRIYRDKDVVEKSFDDLKNQLDMKRLRMHSSRATDGRLFVQFIALILMSALRKEMRKSDLIKHYTARELLKEMGTLTKITYAGKYGHILTEVTKPQRKILTDLKIVLPYQT
jgi:transposase